MRSKTNTRVLKALRITAELFNRQMSEDSIKALAWHLQKYTDEAVIDAIMRCQTELKFFPTMTDILSRIDDGRPGPDVAWSMIPTDEYSSVVWNDEIAGAYGVARNLMHKGDKYGARMAFREEYEKTVARNRSAGIEPKWIPSFGLDKPGRAAALLEAVEAKRIQIGEAVRIMPEIEEYAAGHLVLKSPEARLALTGGTAPQLPVPRKQKEKIMELVQSMPKEIK